MALFDFVHSPPNEAPLADLFAFVSVDEAGEGIIASIIPDIGATLLVTGRLRITEKMKPLAEQAARQTGKRVRLVRFARAQVLWEG